MRRPTLRMAGLLVVVALAACARIPTSGAVEEGNGDVPNQDPVVVLAAGPQQDSQPEQIVDDFMLAGAAGVSAGLHFEVARQYLWGGKAADWNPLGGVLVVSDTKVERPSDTQVTVKASVVGKVDADGRYTEASSPALETVTFDMVQDTKQQWRIADAPDGLILPLRQFQAQFRQVSLYFLTPDASMLVPDPRWYPAVNLPTSVVKGLIAGPSPWLRDAVRTAVPQGVTLSPESVPVDSVGAVEVDLGPAPVVQASDRDLLVAQVEATLRQLPQVRSVVVRAGKDGPVVTGDKALTTAGATYYTGGPEMIATDDKNGEQLVTLTDGRLAPVAGVGALTKLDVQALARNTDGSVRAMLSGNGVLTLAPTASAPPATLLNTGPAAPSVDRFGWIWTASGGALSAVDTKGTTVPVVAPWLADRQVKALRVSWDGTRVAIVSSGQDGVTVDVAGVARDDNGGPQQLSDPERVGGALTAADAVVWIDDNLLAVLGIDGASASVWEVPVGGLSKQLPDVAGAVSLAGGHLERSLLVATQDGELWRYSGPTWAPVPGVSGVRAPSYPG
ncbi:MAG TPA: LpqB family beta-propeller domain-containing protein [Cellulomonas sp.]